jgi:transcription initiation factor TFIID subunit 5
MWPVFVHLYLNLIAEGYIDEARHFYERYQDVFSPERDDALRQLKAVTLPEHLQESEIAKTYRGSKYTLTMSNAVFNQLIQFLEAKAKQGGAIILSIINLSMVIKTVDRAADDRYSLAAMLARANSDDQEPPEEEGIAGQTNSSAYTPSPFTALPKLKLGKAEMDQEKRDDIRVELMDEDSEHPPLPNQPSYGQTFEQMIKVEDDEFTESPQLNEIPYPKANARDVALEVTKVKENRDRFKIEGRTGGVGPGMSVIMYTMHNTFDRQVSLKL